MPSERPFFIIPTCGFPVQFREVSSVGYSRANGYKRSLAVIETTATSTHFGHVAARRGATANNHNRKPSQDSYDFIASNTEIAAMKAPG